MTSCTKRSFSRAPVVKSNDEGDNSLSIHIQDTDIREVLELISGGNSGTLGSMGLLLTQIGYTRSAERRADLTAVRLLRRAAISPKGLSEFFRRLTKIEGGDNTGKKGPVGDMEIFSTHPPSEDRAKMFDGLAPYATTPALTPEQWSKLTAICDK